MCFFFPLWIRDCVILHCWHSVLTWHARWFAPLNHLDMRHQKLFGKGKVLLNKKKINKKNLAGDHLLNHCVWSQQRWICKNIYELYDQKRTWFENKTKSWIIYVSTLWGKLNTEPVRAANITLNSELAVSIQDQYQSLNGSFLTWDPPW